MSPRGSRWVLGYYGRPKVAPTDGVGWVYCTHPVRDLFIVISGRRRRRPLPTVREGYIIPVRFAVGASLSRATKGRPYGWGGMVRSTRRGDVPQAAVRPPPYHI